MIRQAKKVDLNTVKEFHDKQSSHHLDFENILYHGVYENENGIIAYGAVKAFHELVISVNKDRSVRDRTEAIKELLNACVYLSGSEGPTKLFALAEPEFAETLVKHFGFTLLSEQVLALKVNNGPQEL